MKRTFVTFLLTLLLSYPCQAQYSTTNLEPAYGQICVDTESPASISMGTSFAPWTDAAVDCGPADGTLVTTSSVTDDITIGTDGAGAYKIEWSLSFNGSTNTTYHFAAFLNGTTKITSVAGERKLASSNDEGSVSAQGLWHLVAGDVVDLQGSTDSASKTLTADHVSLTVVRVGP